MDYLSVVLVGLSDYLNSSWDIFKIEIERIKYI